MGFFADPDRVKADVIAGPTTLAPSTAYTLGNSYTEWGIQFTATTNAVLTGFEHVHSFPSLADVSGQIILRNVTANTQTTLVASTANTPQVAAYSGLNAPLVAGNVYQLFSNSIGTGPYAGFRDGYFVYTTSPLPGFSFPLSNSQISVTSGYFNTMAGLDTFTSANGWAAFRNIQTAAVLSEPVPEPTSLAVFGGLAAAGLFARRRRTAAA